MCTPNHNALLSYGLKVPAPPPYLHLSPTQLSPFDFQRSQLCEYSARLQLSLRGYTHALATGLSPYHAAAYLADPYAQAYLYKADPRARFVQEEPKPSHSYIGLIAMAILGSKEKKLVLSDIYQWILDNYPYFRTRGPGWRNSIRHNLSLNDCFIKSGRSANGKGHYWAVHPANVDDFTRGDFRRRRAQRKVRKHMGLAVPDDDDDSPSSSPNPGNWSQNRSDSPPTENRDSHDIDEIVDDRSTSEKRFANEPIVSSVGGENRLLIQGSCVAFRPVTGCGSAEASMTVAHVSKKRLFDVESLLAPDFPVVVVPSIRVLGTALPSPSAGHLNNDTEEKCPTLDTDQGMINVVHRSAGDIDHDDNGSSDVDVESEDVFDSDNNNSINDDINGHMTKDSDNHDMSTECTSNEIPASSGGNIHTSGSRDNKHHRDNGSDCKIAITSSFPCSFISNSSSSILDLSASPHISLTSTSPHISLASSSQRSAGATRDRSSRSIPSGVKKESDCGWSAGSRWSLSGVGPRHHSAFQSTSISSQRGAMQASSTPFLHPVFAAARYSLVLPSGPPLVDSSSADSMTREGRADTGTAVTDEL